jgi:hypothetical protein
MAIVRFACPLAVLVLTGMLGTAVAASTTWIEPGRTFMLGGEQTTPLRLEGRNTGNVAVEVLLLADGRETPVAAALPGKRFSLELPPKQTALFRNRSASRATLGFVLDRDSGALSMRYDAP